MPGIEPATPALPRTAPAPAPAPGPAPWRERFTDPWRICPQQVRELGSPDIAP